MCEYQKYIVANLSDLTKFTTNDPILLSKCLEDEILSDNEIQELNLLINTQQKFASKFWHYVRTRSNCLDKLAITFREVNQSKIVEILENRLRDDEFDQSQFSSRASQSDVGLLRAPQSDSSVNLTAGINHPIPENPDSMVTTIKTDKITYDATDILGVGSGGTNVYLGHFGARQVAVKCIPNFKASYKAEAKQEIQALIKCDSHPNIVRYISMSEETDKILLAVEICDANLEQLISGDKKLSKNISQLEVLRQATDGLAYLHGQDILHRDLKPSNILVSNSASYFATVKIADFGTSRFIETGRKSRTVTSPGGTNGYLAPEVLELLDNPPQNSANSITLPKLKINREADIFSLGCIFCYYLTNGKHPFGDRISKQDANIMDGLTVVDEKSDSQEVRQNLLLILSMIAKDSAKRPSAISVLNDPIFWPNKKKLQFLVDISNFVEDITGNQANTMVFTEADKPEADKRQKKQKCVDSLEKGYYSKIAGVAADGWFSRISGPVYTHLKTSGFTKNRYDSVIHLVRVIRNMQNHYEAGQLPAGVKEELGDMPDGFMNFWLEYFPALIYRVRKHFSDFGEETCLQEYYKCYIDL